MYNVENVQQALVGTCEPKTVPIEDRLRYDLSQLQKREAELIEALEILGRNPDLARLYTIINGRL